MDKESLRDLHRLGGCAACFRRAKHHARQDSESPFHHTTPGTGWSGEMDKESLRDLHRFGGCAACFRRGGSAACSCRWPHRSFFDGLLFDLRYYYLTAFVWWESRDCSPPSA